VDTELHAGALKEYSEWAPVGRLSECKTIAACAFLTAHPDFRMDACAVLRVVGGRKQLQASRLPSFWQGHQCLLECYNLIVLRACYPTQVRCARIRLSSFGGENHAHLQLLLLFPGTGSAES